MKKLAIATAAILYCFASFGMENNLPVQDEFDTYVRGWAKELAAPLSEREDRDLNEFSTVPFKKKLLDEIGNDSLAQEEFKLFHTHDFVGLWKHWGESRDRMLPNNAEKFRDLLILSAPIINAEKSNEPYVKEIIDLAGGAEKMDPYCPKFQQFSYEMFFCLTFDTNDHPIKYDHQFKYDYQYLSNELLSRICGIICGDIASDWSWPLRDDELKLMIIIGSGSDIGELMCMYRFHTDWIKKNSNENNSEK